MTRQLIAVGIALSIAAAAPLAQGNRLASPDGSSATEVGGQYIPGFDPPEYRGGKWIEISYEYTADKDVVRAPMKLETLPFSMDQLAWNFVDMSDAGGRLAILWDKVMASVPFTIGK